MDPDQNSILQRTREMPPPAVAALSYREQLRLATAMAEQDPSVHFDTLRPFGDEFWNLIDGRRTVAEIAHILCLQFGVSVDPILFVAFARGMLANGLATVAENTADSCG